MSPWQSLGVAPDIAVADLRRRYAALIKEFRPETHPQDFARIREAYEVVLAHARRREALAAERAEAEDLEVAVAHVEPVLRAADDSTTSRFDDEATTPTEGIAPPLVDEAPPRRQAEAALAAHLRRFHAQAAAAQGSDDEAHLPALRALLQARTQATLDDSQALEFALMRWFIEAESPPLTLLFETGRAFDWHRHAERLSTWLSPRALRQMEARLALSRDLVYARHFSGNGRLGRLHSTHAGAALVVLRPTAVEALSWAKRWRLASDAADAPALADCLNPVALRQLHGLASTDLLVGLVIAGFATDLAGAATCGVLAAAAVFGLRRLLLSIGDLPASHRVRHASAVLIEYRIVAGVLSVVTAILGIVVFTAPDSKGALAIAIASLLIAPLALFATAAGWRIAAWAELALASPFQWREAVDRLEFDRFLRSGQTADAVRPFGARLGVIHRLRSIRPAMRLQAVEIAARERPPRPTPFSPLRGSSIQNSRWRVTWFLAWIAFAILRALHAFGGAS
jgi:hypothetical protein